MLFYVRVNSVGVSMVCLHTAQIKGYLLQISMIASNPFNWHNTARLISTPVLSVNVFNANGDSVDIQNLSNPLVLVMPRPQGNGINHARTYTRTHARPHTHTLTHTHAHTCMHACMYECMYHLKCVMIKYERMSLI